MLILCILGAGASFFVVLERIWTFSLNYVATECKQSVLCILNISWPTVSLSLRHRSSVAKAGAPVSPQSSPPSPLALLRARGLLLLPDSGRVFDLLVTMVAIGEASVLTVVIWKVFADAGYFNLGRKVSGN